MRRTRCNGGEAVTLWEETDRCTREASRGKGPGTWGKTCGDNVGKDQLPAETGDPPQADKDLLYGATEGSGRVLV